MDPEDEYHSYDDDEPWMNPYILESLSYEHLMVEYMQLLELMEEQSE